MQGNGFMELVKAPGRGRLFERPVVPGLGDTAPSGRARLDAIARWIQDAAYLDVVDAGLAGEGAWVVRRMRMRVERFPCLAEALSARTFCSGFGTLVAERRTTLAGADGGLVEAVAIWVHLDAQSRMPARLGERFHALYAESAGERKARSRLGHPPPPADAVASSWRFRAADLDVAGHVNNAAYWAAIEEELIAGDEPTTLDLEIEFREPAPAGDAVRLRAGSGLWIASTAGTVHASVQGLV